MPWLIRRLALPLLVLLFAAPSPAAETPAATSAPVAVKPTAAPDEPLLLVGARLVDPATRRVAQGNLLLVDGRIRPAPGGVPEGFAGRILDLEGKWVIPALHDLHTHSYGNAAPGRVTEFLGPAGTAKRMLYSGVAGFLDLFNLEDSILGLRDQQRGAGLPGADIFAAGPCLTATGGHCSEYGIPTRLIDSPDDARRQVGELAAKRPDVVKVVYHHTPGAMPTIDRPTLEAAIATAGEHHLPTVIHVGSWQDARDATEAGATAVTHIPGDGVVPDDLARLMAERGVTSIPTLAVHIDRGRWPGGAVLDDPLLKAVASENILAAYRTQELDDEHRARLAERAADTLASVNKLHQAGVEIVTGTDAGNTGVVQGFSVHRELALLVEAGLSPWDALAASTTRAGELLGRDWGLAPGDEASLVVLDASPIDDIRNTQKIHLIIHHGRIVDRDALLR